MGEVLLLEPERAFFSDRTPTGLRYLLNSARGLEHPAAVEALLLEARQRWREEPDAHVGLYKFYFLQARYAEAEAAVWEALRRGPGCAGL